MARPPFKKVNPGEKLHVRGGDWNAFIDAALAEINRRGSVRQTPHRKPASSGIVRVRNDSGADVDRFGILGVSGVLHLPSLYLDSFKYEGVNLTGTTPAAADHTGQFVIALEPIPTGGIGFAVASGACQAKLNVTDTAHQFADVEDGSRARLASADQGAARILWKESGTGEKWAVVRLAGHRPLCIDDLPTSTTDATGTDTAGNLLVKGSMYVDDDGDLNPFVILDPDALPGGSGPWEISCAKRIRFGPNGPAGGELLDANDWRGRDVEYHCHYIASADPDSAELWSPGIWGFPANVNTAVVIGKDYAAGDHTLIQGDRWVVYFDCDNSDGDGPGALRVKAVGTPSSNEHLIVRVFAGHQQPTDDVDWS